MQRVGWRKVREQGEPGDHIERSRDWEGIKLR
jgi:hypothetical protein